ncbi:unnamed protein product [Phyllotreta striolata]|uniref:Transmembrane protein 135 N-terminal domain-containing protein n=1 Tax=Phyllotreta striolata TaxID=444603 RepID=A0A9N9TKI5_PHYSR|nr:unnamed protein product [Phyllotreta striolata]
MPQTLSKMSPIGVSCRDYVHPWTNSCLQASAGLYLYCVYDSFRVYSTVYLLTLLMKGRKPTKEDLKKTFYGILQSTAFLSGTGLGYSLFLCLLRKTMGHYNLLTVSAMPAFLSSVFSILIERPGRRILLALYVSNVATETLWNMAKSRGMIQNIRCGNVAIFGASMAVLSAYFKRGSQEAGGSRGDSMFRVMRFVCGPYEEKLSGENSNSGGVVAENPGNLVENRRNRANRLSFIYNFVVKMAQTLRMYEKHETCRHPFSCFYYTLEGTGRMFTLGLGVQITLKLLLNLGSLIKSPGKIKHILFKRQTLSLALFLGLYNGIFRASSCATRWIRGEDGAANAFISGLLAGAAFVHYPDSTVSLYVLWKVAQITYNSGIEKASSRKCRVSRSSSTASARQFCFTQLFWNPPICGPVIGNSCIPSQAAGSLVCRELR